ncbi:MAG TPA: PEP-CTERM sorting domain-containing protein [Acidobacteriaceae bacterium]
MRLRLRSVATLSCLAAFLTIAAHAETFTFHASGAGIDSSGTLVAVLDSHLADTYDIQSISGTFNGTAITGLLPCPAFDPANPCANADPDNFFFDNLLYIADDQPYLDFNGIGFGVGTSGYEGNFFFDDSNEVSSFAPRASGSYAFFDSNNAKESLDSFTINSSTVPEPGSLILFGSGLLGVFGSMRRRLQS